MEPLTTNQILQELEQPENRIGFSYHNSRTLKWYLDTTLVAYGYGYGGGLLVVRTKNKFLAYGFSQRLQYYRYGPYLTFYSTDVTNTIDEIQNNKFYTNRYVGQEVIDYIETLKQTEEPLGEVDVARWGDTITYRLCRNKKTSKLYGVELSNKRCGANRKLSLTEFYELTEPDKKKNSYGLSRDQIKRDTIPKDIRQRMNGIIAGALL